MKNFLITLFWKQNKWHKHGVLIHTLRVVWYVIKAKQDHMIAAALLHDIGKPFVAYQNEEDIINKEYSFTDHEEKSYQIIKNWTFVSDYTKNIVRYHYLIRDIKNSKKKDLPRFYAKSKIWNDLDKSLQQDLELFLVCDDQGKV